MCADDSPPQTFVIRLEEAKAEWRRRKLPVMFLQQLGKAMILRNRENPERPPQRTVQLCQAPHHAGDLFAETFLCIRVLTARDKDERLAQ
jgi:hypothetical protein